MLDLHSDNGQGPRPIHWASRNGHVAVVDMLLSVREPFKLQGLGQTIPNMIDVHKYAVCHQILKI